MLLITRSLQPPRRSQWRQSSQILPVQRFRRRRGWSWQGSVRPGLLHHKMGNSPIFAALNSWVISVSPKIAANLNVCIFIRCYVCSERSLHWDVRLLCWQTQTLTSWVLYLSRLTVPDADRVEGDRGRGVLVQIYGNIPDHKMCSGLSNHNARELQLGMRGASAWIDSGSSIKKTLLASLMEMSIK